MSKNRFRMHLAERVSLSLLAVAILIYIGVVTFTRSGDYPAIPAGSAVDSTANIADVPNTACDTAKRAEQHGAKADSPDGHVKKPVSASDNRSRRNKKNRQPVPQRDHLNELVPDE